MLMTRSSVAPKISGLVVMLTLPDAAVSVLSCHLMPPTGYPIFPPVTWARVVTLDLVIPELHSAVSYLVSEVSLFLVCILLMTVFASVAYFSVIAPFSSFSVISEALFRVNFFCHFFEYILELSQFFCSL